MSAIRQLTRLSKASSPVLRSAFSTTSQRLAKGDDSTIDFFKFPETNYVAPEDRPLQPKVPSLPDSWTTLDSLKPVAPAGSSVSAEFVPGEILHVSGQATASTMSDTEPLSRGQNELLSFFESSSSEAGSGDKVKLEELSSKDKSVLWAIAGGVALYWVTGEALFSKEADKHPEDL